MFKKILVAILSAVMALCAFAGCGGGGENNSGKTVLNVGIFNGGWGMTWLETAAQKFEEKNPEYRVLVDGDKKYQMSNLLGTIDVLPQDVFVGAPCYLYDYVSQNKLMDVTDIMITPLKDLGIGVNEDVTIASKMWSDLDEYYKGYNNQGKYFAAPFGGGVRAISYDIDLFEQKGFYFDADGNWTTGLTTNGANAKSVGQDGQAGTYDDGLPVTEDDFWKLCDYMASENVIPFVWSDQGQYTTNFIYSIIAAYEGKDNFDLIKTLNGTYEANDGTVYNITADNGYELVNMDGRKAALEFAKKLVTNSDYFHPQSGTASMGFMTAQSEYLLSVENAKLNRGKRIAFIIDGSHWLNEATDTFNDMAEMSAEYANRRLGVMPFPKFANQHATKTTYFASSFYTSTFIKKNPKQAEAAKKFFAYLHSDEALQICTQESGMPRAMNYSMTNEQLSTMNVYYQTLWGAWSGDQNDVVYHTCNNPIIYKNEQFFEGSWKFDTTTADGKTLNDPITEFKTYPTLTVDEYLNSLKATIRTAWSGLNK